MLMLGMIELIHVFLDASSHLSKRVCPSIRMLVRLQLFFLCAKKKSRGWRGEEIGNEKGSAEGRDEGRGNKGDASDSRVFGLVSFLVVHEDHIRMA